MFQTTNQKRIQSLVATVNPPLKTTTFPGPPGRPRGFRPGPLFLTELAEHLPEPWDTTYHPRETIGNQHV